MVDKKQIDLNTSSTFRGASSIEIQEVTADNWESYRDFYKALAKPINFRGYMQDKDLDDPETFKKLFSMIEKDMNAAKVFGLFREGQMIGQVMYYIEGEGDDKAAITQGLEMADAHKGLGLFKKLTDAVVSHIKHHNGPEIKVMTSIRQDNAPSLRIAQAYGMRIVETGERAEKLQASGYHLLEYTAPKV